MHLEEVGFEGVPKVTVGEPLHNFMTSWRSTKVAEDGVNVVKSVKRLSGSGKHQAGEFLHHLVTSTVLDEADRPRPPVTTITADLKKKLRGIAQALSRGSIQSTSLDTEKLFGLSSSSFDTLSAECWRLQGCYTESFLNAQDDLGDIDNAWMSRLARRGTVLHKVGGGNEAFLVCGHTPCGVVALRLTMRAVDRLDGTRFKFLVLSLRQAETNLEHAKDFCRYVVVRDRAWVLGALSFIPTSHVNMSTFSAESQALLKFESMLIIATDFVRIVELNAARAFNGLTEAMMPKLAKVLDPVFVPGAHPRNMRDWVRACVKAALPLLPDDEVDEIVSLRFDGGEDDTDDDEMDLSGAGAVAAQNSSLLREALDEDDFKAIEKDREKRKNVYLKT